MRIKLIFNNATGEVNGVALDHPTGWDDIFAKAYSLSHMEGFVLNHSFINVCRDADIRSFETAKLASELEKIYPIMKIV